MKLIKSFFSVLFSATLLLSTTTVNSIAIEKLHFVIGGGAGGGWDGTLTMCILATTILIVLWHIYKTLTKNKS